MRLYEHEAKRVFRGRGLPVPAQFGLIHSPEELEGLKPEFPLMLKAQVLVGGRGKAGGIKRAENLAEAETKAKEIFSLKIGGYPVEAILLEEVLEGEAACYIGATMDPATFNNVVLASASGGVEIEAVARERPEAIHKLELRENEPELPPESARELAERLVRDLGEASRPVAVEELARLIGQLYGLYQAIDAKVCEINPLLITPKGPVAADAKIVLDDNALFRQAKLLEELGIPGRRHDVAEPTANERRAQAAGFKYVDLFPPEASKDPERIYVGLVPGGAGYGIFSIDEVANIGERFFDGRVVPFNFMDSGGGPTQEQMAEMFHLLMDDPRVDLIITSRFGGISSCDIFIRGLVQALRERHAQGKRIVPVYGRMVGTDLPSARDYLEKAKEETPEALKDMEIIVGNQKIMAEVIKEGLSRAFTSRRE